MVKERTAPKQSAKQEYNIGRMLESELSHMDLPIAIFELVDNALDETPSGQTSEIVITFDARDKRIVFENRSTTGMDPLKLQNFMQWGQEHDDPSKLKEHGQGGKLGILFMLSKETGSLTITSSPPGRPEAYQMEIPNWWKNLKPGQHFEINSLQNTSEDPKNGYTRLALEGLREDVIPTTLSALADRIGFVYSPLLRIQRLSVKLRRLSRGGKVDENFSVLPIDVPLMKETLHLKENVPVDKGKIKLDIAFGMLDLNTRERQAGERKGYYGATSVFEPQGEILRIFYRGKLIDEQPLSKLTEGRSRRMASYNFVVVANITQGFVEKTILKTGLSRSSPTTLKIYDAIKETINPYLSEILRASDSKSITLADKRKVEEAYTKFQTVLLRMHRNDFERIREEFNLPTTAQHSLKEPGKPRDKAGDVVPSEPITNLPGIRAGEVLPKDKKLRVSRATNPIPEITLASLEDNYPNARVYKDEAGQKLVVRLNVNSPDVGLALQTRGVLGVAQLMRIAAWAMYHEKWIRAYPDDVRHYLDGVQSDVAELLAKAEEFKII